MKNTQRKKGDIKLRWINRVYAINSTVLFFDNSAFIKYVIHKGSSDKEMIKNHKTTFQAGSKI